MKLMNLKLHQLEVFNVDFINSFAKLLSWYVVRLVNKLNLF
jgi:hypothetical protein